MSEDKPKDITKRLREYIEYATAARSFADVGFYENVLAEVERLKRQNQLYSLDSEWRDYTHLAEEVERLRGEKEKAEAVIEAAKCIRHWHDSGEDGMVVSAEHVRKLWDALSAIEAKE